MSIYRTRIDIIDAVDAWTDPDAPPLTSSDHAAFMGAVRRLTAQARNWVEEMREVRA